MVEYQTRVLHGVGRFCCCKYICEILKYTSLDVLSAFCIWPFFLSQLHPWYALLKSGEHLKSCWWFPSIYPCLINTVMRLPLNTTLAIALHFSSFHIPTLQKGSKYSGICAHKCYYTETSMLLTLKWHLVGSTTRPNLNHLLATEKSTFLV